MWEDCKFISKYKFESFRNPCHCSSRSMYLVGEYIFSGNSSIVVDK